MYPVNMKIHYARIRKNKDAVKHLALYINIQRCLLNSYPELQEILIKLYSGKKEISMKTTMYGRRKKMDNQKFKM